MHLAQWSDGHLDLDATLATLPASDQDSADLMVTMWPDELAHVPGDKIWHAWDGKHLRPDEDNQARKRISQYADALRIMLVRARQQLAIEVEQRMAGQPRAAIDAALKQAWDQDWEASSQVKYARGLRRSQGATALLTALITRCSVEPGWIADRYPHLLNVGNGILDMSASPPALYPHDPRARMAYLVNADWTPGADCPEFRSLLWQAVGGIEEAYWYLVKSMGYALFGGNPYRLIFFLSGPTSNGKTTLLEILSTVLGQQLCYEAQPGLLAKSRYGRHARHEATMRGKRLITMSETNEQLDLDELQVKRLTGEKHLNVEMLYSKTMTRTGVTWLIIVANNDMPSILHFDPALRQRVVVIPMGPEIPAHLRDRGLMDRICERERDGILQLLVWGCQAAMAGDLLNLPAAVAAKTRAYAEEQNIAQLWVNERCIWNGSSPQIPGADCYRSMEQWIERGKDKPTRQQFYNQLAEVPGITRFGDVNHAKFAGIEIKQDWS